jgi:hypothetical protein
LKEPLQKTQTKQKSRENPLQHFTSNQPLHFNQNHVFPTQTDHKVHKMHVFCSSKQKYKKGLKVGTGRPTLLINQASSVLSVNQKCEKYGGKRLLRVGNQSKLLHLWFLVCKRHTVCCFFFEIKCSTQRESSSMGWRSIKAWIRL